MRGVKKSDGNREETKLQLNIIYLFIYCNFDHLI